MSRFFHTLVVFGAGASLSACGGQTIETGRIGDPAAGGSGRSESGGTSATGGTNGAIFGLGGTQGTGGVIGSGGTEDAGPVPVAGDLAQWNCAYASSTCVYATSQMILADPCPVDPTQPRTAKDCKTGEWFECDAAIYRNKPIEVDCRCTPATDGGMPCNLCVVSVVGLYWHDVLSCKNHEKLCGCAMTGILK